MFLFIMCFPCSASGLWAFGAEILVTVVANRCVVFSVTFPASSGIALGSHVSKPGLIKTQSALLQDFLSGCNV